MYSAGTVCRFGHKSETAELLKEWVDSIASQAGGDLQAASISLGSIGVPESEIQVAPRTSRLPAQHSTLTTSSTRPEDTHTHRV